MVYLHEILHWIKKLSSWVNLGAIKSKIPRIWQALVNISAIVAFVISIYNFYFLYWNSGTIEINMADGVGLNLNKSPHIQVYATFSNDGSPSTWKIIRNINATGWIYRKDKPTEEIKFDWRYVDRFLSVEDYERNYKTSNETIPEDADFFIMFESVATPFIVTGKGTVSKLLRFESSSGGFNFSEPFTFVVEIKATTMDNETYRSPKISYHGSDLVAADITNRTISKWILRNYTQ